MIVASVQHCLHHRLRPLRERRSIEIQSAPNRFLGSSILKTTLLRFQIRTVSPTTLVYEIIGTVQAITRSPCSRKPVLSPSAHMLCCLPQPHAWPNPVRACPGFRSFSCCSLMRGHHQSDVSSRRVACPSRHVSACSISAVHAKTPRGTSPAAPSPHHPLPSISRPAIWSICFYHTHHERHGTSHAMVSLPTG